MTVCYDGVMTTIKPMRYHAPGWAYETGNRSYQVWGPGPVTHDGEPTDQTRTDWQASWTDDQYAGDSRHGVTADEVLAIFPKRIADLFRACWDRR